MPAGMDRDKGPNMTAWGPTTDFGMSSDDVRDAVDLHLARHIGEYQTAFTDEAGWSGSSEEDGPPIDVLVVPPQGERRFAFVSSFGCAFHPLRAKQYEDDGVRRRVEFVLAAQQIGDEKADRRALNLAANTVRQFAKLVHLNPITVEPGETVAFSEDPEPVYDNSDLVAFAFIEPRLPGPGFERMPLSDDDEVTYIAPAPIYRAELDAAYAHGAEALAFALSEGGVTEMIDLSRAPVAEEKPEKPRSWWDKLLSLIGIG